MALYAGPDSHVLGLSFALVTWVANFIISLIGVFISVFFVISHDDLQNGTIEPVELSSSFNQVRNILV